MLAKNKCRDDTELVRKGVLLRSTPEFLNAIKYASDHELAVYKEIERVIDNVKKRLEKKVAEREYTEKKALEIIERQLKFKEEMSVCQKRIHLLWKEYENIEQQIHSKEQDRILLAEEYRYILMKTKIEMEALKSSLDKKAKESSEEDIYRYQVQFGALQYRTEKTVNEINDFVRLHPWIDEVKELNRKKCDVDKRIAEELAQLKKITDDMKSMVTAIDKIERNHKSVLQAISNYEFEIAYQLIGETESKEVFSLSGLKTY